MPTTQDPPPPDPARSPSTGWTVAALLLAWAAFTFWTTSRREFWGAEPRDAVVARAVATTAVSDPVGWLLPRVGDQVRLERPPLLAWLSAATATITGLEPRVAYRLPILLIAVLGLWVTQAAGRTLFGPRAGVLAMAIQGTTGLFFLRAAWLDATLAFAVFVELAVCGFALVALEPRRRRWRRAAWIALAAASLTVSPVAALAAVLAPIAVFFFLSGGLSAVKRGLARVMVGGSWWLFAIPTLAWYGVAASLESSELLRQHVIGLHGSALRPDEASSGPIWLYLAAIVPAFLPWTVWLPAGLLHVKGRMEQPGPRLLTVWCVSHLVVLSLLPAKDVSFLLLLWPAAALSVPVALLDTGEKRSVWEGYLETAGRSAIFWLLRAPLVATALLAMVWLTSLGERWTGWRWLAIGQDTRVASAILVPLGVAGALLWVLSARVRRLGAARDPGGAILEAARGALLWLVAVGFVLPSLDPVLSARDFLLRAEEVTAGSPLRTYGRRRPDEVAWYVRPGVDHLDVPVLETPGSGTSDLEAPGVEAPGSETPTGGREASLPQRVLGEFLASPGGAFLVASEIDVTHLVTQFPSLRRSLHATDVTGHLHGLGPSRLWSSTPPPAELDPATPAPVPPPDAPAGESAGTPAEAPAGAPPETPDETPDETPPGAPSGEPAETPPGTPPPAPAPAPGSEAPPG